ncbi:MAG: insulinase family protein [Leptolyngbya sp. SIOISBB]|nr:insulinase family protein [Leptolyngbya sp. SIOISBB]
MLLAVITAALAINSEPSAQATVPETQMPNQALAPASPKQLQVEKFTLSNGLQVWVHYEPTSTIARTDLIIKVGSRNETQAISGISHLLEHMTFTGTEQWDEEQVVNKIDQLGGRWNAYTNKNITNYYATVPAQELETALEWLSQVVFHTTLPADKLDREREIVFQEKGGRYDWVWSQVERFGLDYDLTTKLRKQAFTDSSFHLPVIGRDTALDRITRADLSNYYQQHYLPNNAVLLVVGNTPPEQVITAAQQFFGDLVPRDLPPRPETPQARSPETSQPIIVRGADRSEQVRIKLLAPTVAWGQPDQWVLSVAAAALDKQLQDELRLKRGLVYSARASTRSYRDFGYFEISTRVKRQNTDEALMAIRETLAAWQQGQISPTDVEEAKQALIGKWLLSMDSTENRAYWFASWVDVSEPDEPIPYYPEEIERVTVADVRQVSQAYLQLNQFYTGMHQPIVTITSAVKGGIILLCLVSAGALGVYGWRKYAQR